MIAMWMRRGVGMAPAPRSRPALRPSHSQLTRGSPLLRMNVRPARICVRSLDEEASPDAGQADEGVGSMERAAALLKDFCSTFPELSDEVMGGLLGNVPNLLSAPLPEVRMKLEELSIALGVTLTTAAKLVGKAPAVWEWKLESCVQKMQLLSSSLGDLPLSLVAELIIAQPTIWAINELHLVADRIDTLAGRMALPMADVVRLISKQPMLWAVDPRQIFSNVPSVSAALGLAASAGADLVASMPVVLALDPKLLRLEVVGLSATMGVPVPRMLQLVTRCLGLISVPAEVLGANVENIRLALDVGVEDVLDVVVSQPTMFCTQLGVIERAMSALCSALDVTRSQALAILVKEPALLYDYDEAVLKSRLVGLATLFETPLAELRSLIPSAPCLLVIAPSTIRACLNVFITQFERSPRESLQLLLQEPATFLSLGPQANAETIEQWSSRLALSPRMVSRLVHEQPGLLDLSPTTVKARLETLSALFGIPFEITVQLVLKHPALAVIPPNVTISRIKSISLALGCSLQLAGSMIAKEPGVLCCTCSAPGEFNSDLKPYADNIQEVAAAYEFYTMDWIQRQVRESAPQRMRGFSDFGN